MRRMTVGFTVSVVCALALICTPDDRADAGVVPDVYNFVFGPAGTPYYSTSYYRPAYYGYRTSYYGVSYPWVYQPSSCCPTQTCYAPCSPCGVVGCSPCGIGGCPSGNCAVSLGTQSTTDGNWKPTPADGDGPEKTYKDESTKDPALPDEGAGRVPDASGPSDNKQEEAPGFGPPAANSDGEKRETLKPEEAVQQRKTAPIKDPVTDESTDDAKSGDDAKAGDGAKTGDDDSADKKNTEEKPAAGKGALRIPALDIDQKVTWRVLTSRRRLTIRSRFPTPTLARRRVNPNENWVPVPSAGTEIVSK